MSEPRIKPTSFRIQNMDASHSTVTLAASLFRVGKGKIMEKRTYFETFVNVCRTPEDYAFDLGVYES